jgi:hypothetical protein
MKNIVFHPLAEEELFDAVTYYEEQRVVLGLELPRRSRTHSQLSHTIP